MITKTFRAKNMLSALQQVQEELGADAIVISMREVPSGPVWATWKKPGVEVIATKNTKKSSISDSEVKQMKTEKPTPEELKREIEKLKKAFSGLEKTPLQDLSSESLIDIDKETKPKTKKTKFDSSDFVQLPDSLPFEEIETKQKNSQISNSFSVFNSTEKLSINLEEIKKTLVLQGVDTEIIENIIYTNQESLSPSIKNNYQRLQKFMAHQLSANLTPLKKSLALVPSKYMVLIGRSGSGKTSTCAKIAAFYKMKMGKNVAWIEADTVKTSAISEARTFAESLDVPFYLAYTPQELSELIGSLVDYDLIVIDTASCNPRVEDRIIELASFLSVIPMGNTYLVSSSTTKTQDLIEAEKTFRQFEIKGLIITKTDETGSFGAIYNHAIKSKLPIYFFTSGVNILGNLIPGDHEKIVTALFTQSFQSE